MRINRMFGFGGCAGAAAGTRMSTRMAARRSSVMGPYHRGRRPRAVERLRLCSVGAKEPREVRVFWRREPVDTLRRIRGLVRLHRDGHGSICGDGEVLVLR